MQDLSTELPPEAEARLAALIAEQSDRRAGEEAEKRARRSLLISHHWPDEYERCSLVGGTHVCRRCLTLYPIAFVVLALSFAGLSPWPSALDSVMIWVLCIPATVEFVAEKLWGVPYNGRRQILVTALVALALGRGFAHELDERWSLEFWGPVAVFGTIWFLAAMYRARNNLFEQALAGSREYGPDRDADTTST